MKKIDAYIFKKFISTFFYSISLISVIIIIFDVSEKIEDFIRKKAPFKAIVFDYYLNFLPYFVNLFSPLFTFISVIFFTSKMAYRTEIVAILSSGVSFNRLLRPYMWGASLLAVFSLLLNNFIIPNANKTRLDFEEMYVGNPFTNQDVNIHRQIAKGTLIYVERFNSENNVGYRFSMEKHHDGVLYYKLLSESIRWDSIKHGWSLNNYIIRTIDSTHETIRKGYQLDTVYNFTPKDFGRRLNNIERMNYFELNRFIEEEDSRGADKTELYKIEKHTRFAFPFATFILTLIGVAVSSRKVRGGIGLHIGLGLLISFSFIMFMQIFKTLAASGSIPAAVAVWIPNAIYALLALYLVKLAPK